MIMKKRNPNIDIARGIAMISIVLGHLGLPSVNRVVFTYHLPIFFIVSGFFVTNKKSIVEFAKNKIKTLIIPYYFSCFLIILSAVIVNYTVTEKEQVIMIIKSWLYASFYGAGDSYSEPFYIKGIGAIWFLWATFWGIIILRILLELKWQTRLLSVICFFFVGYLSGTKLFWFPLSIQAGFVSVLYMYFGFIIKQIYDMKILEDISVEIKGAGLFFSIVIWISFIKNFKSFWLVHADIGRGAIDVASSLCACYIIITVSNLINSHLNLLGRGLAFLGENSIVFLSAHIIELNTFKWNDWINCLFKDDLSKISYLVIIIILKFLWIILFLLVFTRIGITRRIYGIKESK